MAFSKIILNGVTQIDLTQDSVKSNTLLIGNTAHDNAGLPVEGEFSVQTQTKSATPSETAQTITPDTGKYLSSVSVGAISSTYVGSGILRESSADLTASGATVTAPAGYYESSASKSVATGSATAPASISGTSATVTAGTNTLTLSKTVSVTPSVTAGYVSSGTAGNSSVSLTASVTTQAAKTVTPSTSQQTAVDAGTYCTGAITVSAMPSGTAGTPTATKGTVSNHQISITPSVTNTTGYITGSTKTGTAVTVSASELVSGSQTITSNQTVNVTNLASVVVAVPYSTIYDGSSAPSSSTGVDGDIYLQT